jgi:hypothetical protein
MHAERLSWFCLILNEALRHLQFVLGGLDDDTIRDVDTHPQLLCVSGELLSLAHQVAGRLVGCVEPGPAGETSAIRPSEVALPALDLDCYETTLASIATDCRYALRQLGDPHIGRETWSAMNDARRRALLSLERVVAALDAREVGTPPAAPQPVKRDVRLTLFDDADVELAYFPLPPLGPGDQVEFGPITIGVEMTGFYGVTRPVPGGDVTARLRIECRALDS